jgi:hypothetical protein
MYKNDWAFAVRWFLQSHHYCLQPVRAFCFWAEKKIWEKMRLHQSYFYIYPVN